MSGLFERAAVVLQLRKSFEASGPAAAVTPTRANSGALQWLPRPDPAMVGREETHRWLLPCLLAALCVSGAVSAARCWERIENAHLTANWPYTRGVITSSEAQPLTNSQGVRWHPIIRYAYRVGQREIVGSRLSLEEPLSGLDEAAARNYVARYRLRTPVLVYYNPEQISQAVLEQSAPRSAYLGLYLGALLAALGGGLLATSLFRRERKTRQRASPTVRSGLGVGQFLDARPDSAQAAIGQPARKECDRRCETRAEPEQSILP